MASVTHREENDFRAAVRRHGVALLLAAAALAFFLPFGTVACDGEVVHFTGVQLAARNVPPDTTSTRYTSDNDSLDEQVEDGAGTIALMALVFGIAGIASAVRRGLGGGFAVASLLSFLLLLADAAVSFADVTIEVGFWLALGLVLAAVFCRARARWLARRASRQQGVTRREVSFSVWLRRHAPSWALGAGAIGVIVLLDAAARQTS